MEWYPILKWLHIVNSAILFGTGLGTAWHMWAAHRTGDVKGIAIAARNTIHADFIFTLPAVIIQPLTGILLILIVGFPWDMPWLLASYALYLIAGACWIPVVFLQIKAARLAGIASKTGKPLPADYFRAMIIWYRLGWPAFIAVFVIFYLMVAKPLLWEG